MLKVLIVDDEILLRTKLKTLLNWEEKGFILCGEALNGVEALGMIKKMNPEIVLSDVQMPIMDGLQLSYELKEKYPDVKLIVMSNYDEFKYVKNILKNGAIDYILKHELNRDTLLDALERAKTAIALSSNKNEEDELKNESVDNLTALREKFVIQLLIGIYKDEEVIKKHMDTLDIRVDVKNIAIIVMVIDNYLFSMNEKNLRNISMFEHTIINILQEVLNDFGNGIINHIANEKFVIVLSFANYRSKVQIENRMNELLYRISVCLKEFMNISASYSISELCASISDISKIYEAADKNLKDRFYSGKNCILKNVPYIKEKESLEGLSIEAEKRILACIKTKNNDDLSMHLDIIFDAIISQRLSITSYQLIFGDLLSVINRVCKDHLIDLSVIYPGRESPHQMLAQLETINETRVWFRTLFTRLLESLTSDLDHVNSEYVKKAVRFIKNNFAEPISLSNIAEQIGISCAYLSTLFKEETGTSFCDFVTNIRLEKAKALLEEGTMDLKEIVLSCGFSDYSYFIKTFRKKIGVTPKEYIKKLF